MVAQYCEGKDWICWQEFTMASKFRGKYLQVVPLGTAHLTFPKSGKICKQLFNNIKYLS